MCILSLHARGRAKIRNYLSNVIFVIEFRNLTLVLEAIRFFIETIRFCSQNGVFNPDYR